MLRLLQRATTRALVFLSVLVPVGAMAQFGVPAPVTPAPPCPAFTGFPLTLNLGTASLFGNDGITNRCAFQTTQAALNALSAQAAGSATAITSEVSRATAAEALLAPLASPTFTGTATIPKVALTGAGSTGDVSGMSVTPSASAASGTLSNLLYAPTFFGAQTSGANGLRAVMPAGAMGYALNANLSPSGTVNGNYFPNGISSTSDTVSAGSGFVNMWTVSNFFGGSGTSGGRQSIQGQSYLTAPTAATNPNRNYVAVDGHSTAQSSDGGTNLTADARGAVFGVGMEGILCGTAVTPDCPNGTPATNMLNVTSAEANVAAFAGSSVKIKAGFQIAALSNDAVQGSTVDAALAISNQAPAVGFKNAILLHDQNGAWPLSSDACLFCTLGGAGKTIQQGIDMSSLTITANAFSSPFAFIAGSTGTLTLGNPNKSSASTAINFASGGFGSAADGRIIATGGSSTPLTGTLNYQAAAHSFAGNIGFNGATPVGKCSLAAALPTDGSVNSAQLAVAINSVRSCLISVGLGQ